MDLCEFRHEAALEGSPFVRVMWIFPECICMFRLLLLFHICPQIEAGFFVFFFCNCKCCLNLNVLWTSQVNLRLRFFAPQQSDVPLLFFFYYFKEKQLQCATEWHHSNQCACIFNSGLKKKEKKKGKKKNASIKAGAAAPSVRLFVLLLPSLRVAAAAREVRERR